jgi:hypothetical protein
VTARAARLAAVLASAAAAAAAWPATAPADYAPATTVDGPNADVVSLGGVDIARTDATGAVAYLKRELAQAKVFVAPLVRGNPGAPVRVDTGQIGDASQLRMAAGEKGRTAVVWVNNGILYGAYKAAGDGAFGPPKQIYAGGPVSEVAFDMSIFGTGYVTFTTAGAGGHDVRAALLDGGNWTVLPQTVDIDGNRDARGAQVAASSDGTGIVAWTESGTDGISHVYERRLLRGKVSTVPQEAGVPNLDGRPSGAADSPVVDVHDDSTYAWVAFRQEFNDGGATRSRAIARRLAGSRFEQVVPIDGLGFPTAQNAERPVLDLTGRGYGMAMSNLTGSNAINGVALSRRQDPLTPTFEPPVAIDSGAGGPPMTTVTSSEDAKGIVAWQRTANGSNSVVARYYDGTQFQFAYTLSPPAYGTTAADLGLDASSDGAGDSVIAFVQGLPAQRRIQVVAFPGKLTAGRVAGTRAWKRNRRPAMRWKKTLTVPWGPVRYRVEIDGVPVATTDGTSFKPQQPLTDGVHAVRIVVIDGRGAETDGRDAGIRIDRRKPTGRLRKLGKGLWSVSASDGPAIFGSGIASAKLVFGRRDSVAVRIPSVPLVENAKVRHRRKGRPRLVIVDRAGNKKVVK